MRHSPVNEAMGFARALETAASHFATAAADEAKRLRRAQLYVLGATLRDAERLESPAARLVEPLRTALDALPPQREGDVGDDPFWQWLDIAALADQEADYALAGEMLTAVMAHLDDEPVSDARQERRAMCWARRGRLSRQQGKLDDAEECFREALRLVRGRPASDAWAQAQLGLSVVHMLRGNVPLMERCLRRVVSHRPAVSAVFRVPAHQALADASRTRGQYMDALLHAWQAFDMLDREDVRRLEVMNVLAEVALEAGELDASEQGSQYVLATRGPERVMSPASSCRVRVQVMRIRRARDGSDRMQAVKALRSALAVVQEVLDDAVQPGERANLLTTQGEGLMALGDLDGAAAKLEAALDLSVKLSFNKHAFRAEALLSRLAALREHARLGTQGNPESNNRDVAAAPRAGSGRAHPAVLRLLQFDAT